MTIQDRLKSFRNQICTTPEALGAELTAKGFKITAPTIYGYENGQRQPSVAYISALIEYYDANPLWLLQGIGEMFKNEEDKFKSTLPKNLDLNDTVFVPVINFNVSAGYGALAEDIEMTKDFISFSKSWLVKQISGTLKDVVIFKVKGDSMDGGESHIKDGSYIITDTSVKEYRNDGIYAIRLEDSLFVKRLQYLPGKILVKSDNPAYQSFEINPKVDDFKVIGCVVYTLNRVSCV